MGKKLCVVCQKNKPRVPDINIQGRPIKRVCLDCHGRRLQGDLSIILKKEHNPSKTSLKIKDPKCFAQEMVGLGKTLAYCMKQAQEEFPEESANWTVQEIFEKGSSWAARNVIISET